MSQIESFEIEASTAQGFHLDAGSTIHLINSFGSQVVATWAFNPSNVTEFMSMEHTRVHAKSSRPQPGTVFYTNLHKPILQMTADSSPRVHDWYLAACNQQRYELLGHIGEHANCTDNLLEVLNGLGHATSFVPSPLNLFENVSFLFGNPMEIKAPVAMPGDFVCLEAKTDCLVVMSTCPQDILPTNGPDHTPKKVEVELSTPNEGDRSSDRSY